MSQQFPKAPPPLSIFAMFRIPAIRLYLAIGAAALVVYYFVIALEGGDLGALVALIFAVPGLLGRWVISPILFLLITSYLIFDPQLIPVVSIFESDVYMSRRHSMRDGFDISWLVLAAAVLVYLSVQYRIFGLIGRAMPHDPAPRRRGQPEPPLPRRPESLVTDSEIPGMFMGIGAGLALGLLAWVLIRVLSRARGLTRETTFAPGTLRIVVFVMAFGSGLWLASIVLNYRAMLRMAVERARLILLDNFYHEIRREQERWQRWKKWYRDRETRREIRRKGR